MNLWLPVLTVIGLYTSPGTAGVDLKYSVPVAPPTYNFKDCEEILLPELSLLKDSLKELGIMNVEVKAFCVPLTNQALI